MACLALSGLLLCGCEGLRDIAKRSGEIQAVETAVARHLRHRDVDAYLLNAADFLTVEVRNSPLRDLPAAQKRPKALEIAQLAYSTYASRTSLRAIKVVFVVDKTTSSAFTSSHEYNALDYYEFPVTELGSPQPSQPK